jgi:hypothetical protein
MEWNVSDVTPYHVEDMHRERGRTESTKEKCKFPREREERLTRNQGTN